MNQFFDDKYYQEEEENDDEIKDYLDNIEDEFNFNEKNNKSQNTQA